MMPFFAGMLLAEGFGERILAWAGWAVPVAAFLGKVALFYLFCWADEYAECL